MAVHRTLSMSKTKNLQSQREVDYKKLSKKEESRIQSSNSVVATQHMMLLYGSSSFHELSGSAPKNALKQLRSLERLFVEGYHKCRKQYPYLARLTVRDHRMQWS